MTNPHFAKFADVWKHLPLDEALSAERPRRYWETHAGSAMYPLTPSPERRYGVYWLWDHLDRSELLRGSAYVRLLRGLPEVDGYPARYPGSAMQAMLLLGRGADQYLLCDRDPASARDLDHGARLAGVADLADCHEGDGRDRIAAAIESLADARPLFVHIDPFDSFERGAGGLSPIDLMNALTRLGARVMYWYGYEDPGDRGWIVHVLESSGSSWCGDVLLPERDESGLLGCGVLLANMTERTYERCARLGRELVRVYTDAVLPSGSVGSPSFREIPPPRATGGA